MGGLSFASAPVLHTTDVDEATVALAHVYIAAQINIIGSARLDLRLNAVQLPSLTAGSCTFGTDVYSAAGAVDAYFINIPLSGGAVTDWADGEQAATDTASAAVFSPDTPAAIMWPGTCSQVCVKIPRERMREELEALLDGPAREPLTFARRLDLTSGGAGDWVELVRILASQASRPNGILSHPLAVESLQQLLIRGVLQIQPHNYTDTLADGCRPPSSDVARHAIELIRVNPELPWSTAELARAVGVSGRALQVAFQRAGEMPPMQYLRWVRLHRVRAELLRRSPDTVTVTTVAGRWGFVHLGRFGRQYRQLFGETPAETLRTAVSRGRAMSR